MSTGQYSVLTSTEHMRREVVSTHDTVAAARDAADAYDRAHQPGCGCTGAVLAEYVTSQVPPPTSVTAQNSAQWHRIGECWFREM